MLSTAAASHPRGTRIHGVAWPGLSLSLAGAQIHGGSGRRRWPTSTGPRGSCLPRHGSRAGQPPPVSPTRGGGGQRRCERGSQIQLPPSFAQHGGVDPGQRRWPRIQGREGGHAVAQHGGADLARWLRQRRTQRDPAWERQI